MSKTSVARIVSTIGHPFTFIVLLVLLPFWLRREAGALRVISIVIVAGLFPLGLFMWQRYASGRWQTVDASARSDRPTLYYGVFAVTLPFSFYFLLVEQSSTLFRGSVVICLMLGVAAVLNRWIKLSLHLAFAGFSGLILARIRLRYALPIGLFIPLLGWSRLALLRHTLGEVIGGLILGIIAASIMLWMQ